jgi:hypothetical protein
MNNLHISAAIRGKCVQARHGSSVLQQSIAQCIDVNIAKLPELFNRT